MQKTYGLAVEKPHGLVALKLPPMSLAMAEKARETVSGYADIKGLTVVVVNFAAQ
jgi:hypothetical protein